MAGSFDHGENPTRVPEEDRLGVLKPGDKTPEQKEDEEHASRILRRDLMHGAVKLLFGYGGAKAIDKVLGAGSGDKEPNVSRDNSQNPDVKIEPSVKQKP